MGSKALGRDGRVLGLNRGPRTWKRKFPAAARAARRISAHYPQFPTWVHETRTRPTKHKAKSSRKVLKEIKDGLSLGLLTRLKKGPFEIRMEQARSQLHGHVHGGQSTDHYSRYSRAITARGRTRWSFRVCQCDRVGTSQFVSYLYRRRRQSSLDLGPESNAKTARRRSHSGVQRRGGNQQFAMVRVATRLGVDCL